MAKVTMEEADKKAHEVSSGLFLKLENDGDKAILVFRIKDDKGVDCIDAKETIWNEKTNKTENYDPVRHKGQNPSVKFTFNSYVIKSGNGDKMHEVNAPKLVSMTTKTFKLALATMRKYGARIGIDGCVFEYERKGAKGDTGTTYTVLPEQPVEASQYPGLVEAIAKAKFFDPEKEDEAQHTSSGPITSQTTNGAAQHQAPAQDATISPELTQSITARIKSLPDPRKKVEELLTRFGVQQVRTLKEVDKDKILKMVDELEGKTPAAAVEPEGVIDPFA